MSDNPGRRRLDVETRRRELLRAGAELLAAHPDDEIWIDDVARRAGVSRGLLYHYFGGKRAFLAAVVEDEAGTLLAATEPDPDLPPGQQLRAALDAYLTYLEAHPSGYRALYLCAAGSDAQIRAIVENNLRRQEQRLLDGVTGGAPVPEPVRLAVRGWLASLIAICLDWLGNPTLDRASLCDLLVSTFAAVITAAGYAPPGAAGA